METRNVTSSSSLPSPSTSNVIRCSRDPSQTFNDISTRFISLTPPHGTLGHRLCHGRYVPFKFAAITWLLTLALGVTVAYFLAFHVRPFIWQLALFLICTVPFLTSNIIRMISWIPFLGRHGIFNATLQAVGLIHEPLEFLLFTDFAVVLAFAHLYTLFMVIPIFNSMMRIDRALLAAAADCGASDWPVVKEVIIPLSKPGMAIGSIFVVTLVMGDFVTVRLMSGGQSASVGLMMMNQISLLQYPAAAANAVMLLLVTLLIVIAIFLAVSLYLGKRTSGAR